MMPVPRAIFANLSQQDTQDGDNSFKKTRHANKGNRHLRASAAAFSIAFSNGRTDFFSIEHAPL